MDIQMVLKCTTFGYLLILSQINPNVKTFSGIKQLYPSNQNK
jgi:hypothetical protein